MKFILDLLTQGAVLLGVFYVIKLICFHRPTVKLDNSVYEQKQADRLTAPIGQEADYY